ncbi:MAG: RsbRD N-terminal domain-containing protein [Myxococcota bacterium]|nr:RsbRD N-terminal domain-containing protein [Myxococcota bacterium]
MALSDILKKRSAAIKDAWLERLLSSYPKDSLQFLKGRADPFANPVGHTLKSGIQTLVDLLVSPEPAAAFRPSLVEILKIRALQGFTPPSQTISFVFSLKDVVRQELKNERMDTASVSKALFALDGRVDEMALMAFDIYAELKERLCEIRINEVKRNVSQLIKRSNYFNSDSDAAPDPQPGDNERQNLQRGGDR